MQSKNVPVCDPSKVEVVPGSHRMTIYGDTKAVTIKHDMCPEDFDVKESRRVCEQIGRASLRGKADLVGEEVGNCFLVQTWRVQS